MNLPTIIVLAVVVILVGLALYFHISSRKRGGSCCDGCEGSCAGCDINRQKETHR